MTVGISGEHVGQDGAGELWEHSELLPPLRTPHRVTLRGLSGLDHLESGELPALLRGGQQVVETHGLLAGWLAGLVEEGRKER